MNKGILDEMIISIREDTTEMNEIDPETIFNYVDVDGATRVLLAALKKQLETFTNTQKSVVCKMAMQLLGTFLFPYNSP